MALDGESKTTLQQQLQSHDDVTQSSYEGRLRPHGDMTQSSYEGRLRPHADITQSSYEGRLRPHDIIYDSSSSSAAVLCDVSKKDVHVNNSGGLLVLAKSAHEQRKKAGGHMYEVPEMM